MIICIGGVSISITIDCSNNRPRLGVWPMYRYSSNWQTLDVAKPGNSRAESMLQVVRLLVP